MDIKKGRILPLQDVLYEFQNSVEKADVKTIVFATPSVPKKTSRSQPASSWSVRSRTRNFFLKV